MIVFVFRTNEDTMSWTDFTRRDYARRCGRCAINLTNREWGIDLRFSSRATLAWPAAQDRSS
jgi:hypothetical protein